MITEQEVVTMCEKLSYKFNSPEHRDDLTQEGILLCYELLAEDPETHPAKLHREAKRRMHDYLNVGLHPVSIPAHSRTKRLTRDIEDEDKGDMSDLGYAWLKSVLSAENLSYDEDFGESPYDHTQNYEDREYHAHVLSVAVTTLNQDEWQVIRMRYYDDMTLHSVAEVMGASHMWVSRTEKSALEKLNSWLV
jgi:RNA polymerase sigma factor (sigma-70 family)